MSFSDEREPEHMPNKLIFTCRRCREDTLVDVLNARITVRESVESGHLLRVCECRDGGIGVAELRGGGPGRPLGEVLAEQRAKEEEAPTP